MVCFDVGINNVHAVSEILEGDRYSMLVSYDYKDSNADAEYLKKMRDEVLEIQSRQKEEWAQGKAIPPKPVMQEKLYNDKNIS